MMNNKYCMEFSNEDIIENIINPAKQYPNVKIYTNLSGEKGYRFVDFDGKDGDFSIMFYNHLTAVFILNEEFMFLDDKAKEDFTSSDAHGNIVYEGTLIDKTHKEILSIIFELFKILVGAKKITKKEIRIALKGWYYQCDYEVSIYNDSGIKKEIQFENIKFLINH